MKSKRRTPAERKASAVHEAGHALERWQARQAGQREPELLASLKMR
jgi:hypothetical protein